MDGFPASLSDRFEPVRLVAGGGFGSVWLARQRALDRPVALKVLHAELVVDDELVSRFRDEARLTASIDHSRVVTLLDYGVETDLPWMAFEYVEGQSLRSWVDRGPSPWREVAEVARQVALALEEARRCGVVHRDIKPDNILRCHSGLFKIADFGVAKWAGSSVKTREGNILGTPAYVSPIQVKGPAPAHQSDLYALGVTMFELVTGRLPFFDPNPIALLEHHLTTPAPSVSSLVADVPGAIVGISCLAVVSLRGRPSPPRASTMAPAHRSAAAVAGATPTADAAAGEAVAVASKVDALCNRALLMLPEARRLRTKAPGEEDLLEGLPASASTQMLECRVLVDDFRRLLHGARGYAGPDGDRLLLIERTGFEVLETVERNLVTRNACEVFGTGVRGASELDSALVKLRMDLRSERADPFVRLIGTSLADQAAALETRPYLRGEGLVTSSAMRAAAGLDNVLLVAGRPHTVHTLIESVCLRERAACRWWRSRRAASGKLMPSTAPERDAVRALVSLVPLALQLSPREAWLRCELRHAHLLLASACLGMIEDTGAEPAARREALAAFARLMRPSSRWPLLGQDLVSVRVGVFPDGRCLTGRFAQSIDARELAEVDAHLRELGRLSRPWNR
ncbi:MAG: serine/threonine protein kinase [Candidatus Riflebacteria bacterium]|nr:serine/threonine protein kinase [Candidatus Riflebacteria bacterium]